MRLPQKEQEASQQASDAAAEAASAADDDADPATTHSAAMGTLLESDSQEGEGQDAEADDSSVEYAGDLNVSDDEATLEEEEVNSYSLGAVQIFD